MKVALIHPHVGYKGGLETRLWNYIRWLLKQGHQITVFGYKVDPDVVMPDGVKLHRFDFSRVPKPIRMAFFNRELRKQGIRERFDYSLSLGRTAHQSDVLCPGLHKGFLKAMGRWWKTPVDYQNIRLDQFAFSQSDRIWAASGMVRDEIVRYHRVPPEKVNVLYPPLDVERFNRGHQDKRTQWRTKFGFLPDDLVVAFASSAHIRKGLPLLEKVWANGLGKQAILAVAGHPSGSNVGGIRDMGFVQNTEELYAAADLLVHPARYEPFGQVVSEAVACGIPVIVSDRVGAKEILEEPWGKVLPHDDATAWAMAIKQMLRDKPSPPADIVARHHLSLEEHMQRLMGHLA